MDDYSSVLFIYIFVKNTFFIKLHLLTESFVYIYLHHKCEFG